MALTLYVEPPGPVHRRHPVAKLMAMIGFFFAAFLTDRALLLLPLAAAVALLLAVSGGLTNVRRLRLLFAMVFTMSFVVWSLFFEGGRPWLSLGPLGVSREGVQFALGMAVKLVTFLAIGVLFLSTTTIEEFSYALVRLGVPYRFGFTLTLAFRLVPVFVDSALTVIQAQRSRGFAFERGNLLERGRRYVPVIVPVFIGALRRADGMAMALEARGFQRRTPRSSYGRYLWQVADGAVIAVSVGVAGGYFVLWQLGHTSAAMVPF